MFFARRRYLSTDLSAEEADQFDRDNCHAYDFSSEQSRWYLTELSHVRFLHWKVSGWLRLENNLVRRVRHAGVFDEHLRNPLVWGSFCQADFMVLRPVSLFGLGAVSPSRPAGL
jgi:hypothetical protein